MAIRYKDRERATKAASKKPTYTGANTLAKQQAAPYLPTGWAAGIPRKRYEGWAAMNRAETDLKMKGAYPAATQKQQQYQYPSTNGYAPYYSYPRTDGGGGGGGGGGSDYTPAPPRWLQLDHLAHRLMAVQYRPRYTDLISKGYQDLQQTGQLYFKPPVTNVGYWDKPGNLYSWRTRLQADVDGSHTPDWIDRDAVELAYQTMSARNEGEPWYRWGYLPDDDPVREMLRSLPVPPEQKPLPEKQAQAQPQTVTPEWAAPKTTAAGLLQAILNDPIPTIYSFFVPDRVPRIGSSSTVTSG